MSTAPQHDGTRRGAVPAIDTAAHTRDAAEAGASFAAEARDPHCLDAAARGALLAAAPWERVVALGDSIAEGVREPSPGYQDLGWVDRIAAALGEVRPALKLRNLGRRDRLAAEVRGQQLAAAVAFGPDLAIVAAGGNDTLRRRFDLAAVEHELEQIVAALRAGGADVLTLGLLDASSSPFVPEELRAPLTARLHELADATRAIAERHGALHLQMREHPVNADPGIYASDGLHLNARGHAIVAGAELARLGAELARRRGAAAPSSPSPSHQHKEHDHA